MYFNLSRCYNLQLMSGPEQNIQKIQEEIIMSLTEEIGRCGTTEEIFDLWLQYFYKYNELCNVQSKGGIVDEMELEIARTKKETVYHEAQLHEAIDRLNDPKTSEADVFDARCVIWFDTINKVVNTKLPPNPTEEQYEGALRGVLQEIPFPDGQIVSVERYFANTEPGLDLD